MPVPAMPYDRHSGQKHLWDAKIERWISSSDFKCKRKKLWLDSIIHGRKSTRASFKINNILCLIENWPYIGPQKTLNNFWMVIIEATVSNSQFNKTRLTNMITK